MEITNKGITTTRIALISLMTTFISLITKNDSSSTFKRSILYYLCKKLPGIWSLLPNKTKSLSALTLKLSKWGNYVTNKRCFKQFYKNNVFLKICNKNRSSLVACSSYATRYIYVISSQYDKRLELINQYEKFAMNVPRPSLVMMA